MLILRFNDNFWGAILGPVQIACQICLYTHVVSQLSLYWNQTSKDEKNRDFRFELFYKRWIRYLLDGCISASKNFFEIAF